jgi:hypothetical protein
MKTLKAVYLITIALGALVAGAVIAAADEPASVNRQSGPPIGRTRPVASSDLTCANCEANGSNSFGYNTYLGQRALVTIAQVAQQKENARRAWVERAGLTQSSNK